MNLKCENENSKKMEEKLKNAHVDINTFLKLFLAWNQLNPKERSECVEKLIND